jgi:hypothetical protein
MTGIHSGLTIGSSNDAQERRGREDTGRSQRQTPIQGRQDGNDPGPGLPRIEGPGGSDPRRDRPEFPFEARIPNATTRKALRDAEAGRDMTDYASVDEMFEDLGI